ncbi:hypothetical protein D3C72_2060650 [compost metagenome]
MLTSQVVAGNAAIEAAHEHLDKLVRKIEHINQIEVRQPAVNESVIQADAEKPIAQHVGQQTPEVRPA